MQCAVSSPPYFGLRSYLPDGHPDKALEIGLEQTPDAYVTTLVGVFREMRRVLADDGVFWLNIGDSYAGYHGNKNHVIPTSSTNGWNNGYNENLRTSPIGRGGIKQKDLLMIPARVALALQADGWYLRSHCIWHKPNPMPESVRDRPTSAHESVFLLTKNARYFYNADAVREKGAEPRPFLAHTRQDGSASLMTGRASRQADGATGFVANGTRNMRNVWVITPRNFRGAHFATFPPELAARCIKAGSRPGDTVIDPFFGAGTTALAMPDRHCIGIDINAAYADLASARLTAAGLNVTVEYPHQPATALEAAE